MVNRRRLIRLTRDLVRINSENPPGDERAVARYVRDVLKGPGLKPRLYNFWRNRTNVLAVLKGRGCAKPLLLTPHLDTVPAGAGWRYGAFSGRLLAGRLYGRGSSDCKGNLAVALEVLLSLAEEGARLERDVIFLATADEEAGSRKGLVPFLEKGLIRPGYALILDSDAFNIITAQKGLVHFKVKVFGLKAHGAYPRRGLSAIDQACRLIRLLKGMGWGSRRHRLLRPPTVNIGTIHGGDKVNMVADRCVFEVDFRFLPGMAPGEALSRIKAVFRKTGVRFRLEVDDIQQPYEISQAHPLVKALKKAAKGITSRSAVRGSEGATVITFFQKMGIPAVATGYGCLGRAHATDEYVRVDDLHKGARVVERFVRIFDVEERGESR